MSEKLREGTFTHVEYAIAPHHVMGKASWELRAETWQQMKDILQDGKGYPTLVQLEERLTERVETFEELLSEQEKRLKAARHMMSVAHDTVRFTDDLEDRAGLTLADAFEHHASTAGSVWDVHLSGAAWDGEEETAATKVHLNFTRSPELLEELREHIGPVDLTGLHTRFAFDDLTQTLGAVLEHVQGRLVDPVWERAETLRPTCEALRFRLAMVRNALHQFEAFGQLQDAPEMKDDRALDEKATGRKPRKTEADLKEVFANVITALENDDSISSMKDACSRAGRPAVQAGTLQRELRDRTLPLLRDRYPDLTLPTNGTVAEWRKCLPDLKKAVNQWEIKV